MQGSCRRGREPADILSWLGRCHSDQGLMFVLAVSIVSIAELAFCHFPAFLGLYAKRRNRARFKALQADFLAGFLAEAIAAVLYTAKCAVDLAQQLPFTVTSPQLEPKFRFLRGTIVRIGEIGGFILHVVHRAIHFIHELVLPRSQDILEMLELPVAHIFFATSDRVRRNAVNRP